MSLLGMGSAWRSTAHGIAVIGYGIAMVVVLAVAAFIISRLREALLERQRAADTSAETLPQMLSAPAGS